MSHRSRVFGENVLSFMLLKCLLIKLLRAELSSTLPISQDYCEVSETVEIENVL